VHPGAPQHAAAQNYGQNGYADPRHGQMQPPIGIPQATDPHDYHGDDEFDDEEYDDELEPESSGRGRKSLMLVLGLVGAIGIGAGCAYAYKTYLGPSTGKPAILKADSAPSKTKPVVPGGKEFSNADRKITARLGEEGAASATSDETSAEPGGPRRVQIIPISPNGGPQAGVAPARAVPPSIQVPGMSVEFGNTPSRLPTQAPPPVAPSQVVQTVPSAPPMSAPQVVPQGQVQAPTRVAVAQVPTPPARAPVQAIPAPDATASAPAKKVAVAKALSAKSSDAFSPAGAPAGVGASAVPAPASAGSSGFVAVVASGGSAKEAMTAYADLKQKYPEVLSDKPADIREAVVNGKTWHRAVIGPPGSRASVDNLCTQLKASGFLGCWASAY
jgi:SPOR domain